MPDPIALIEPQLVRLRSINLFPVIAGEVEFYLHGSQGNPGLRLFWDKIIARAQAMKITIVKCEKEKGPEQHEIAVAPSSDVIKLVQDIESLKRVVTEVAAEYDLRADFSARPVIDEPGNGLHIHVHLKDSKGKNSFYKDDERMSGALSYALGGLLTWMPDCVPVFAPHADSYARFTAKTNAPVTISWGANNRTVALRLPDAAHDNKRIEHRVAGADADVAKVVAVILAGMHYGIEKTIQPGEQIYGDASLPQYNLPRLSKSLEEATARMANSKLLPEYFNVPDLLPAG